MNTITGVASNFNYRGKLCLKIDQAQYHQLLVQFRYYLCKHFNRPPPCFFRTEYGSRAYYFDLTLNKLDRKEDYSFLLGKSVTIKYKLRCYKVKFTSGLVAQLMDVFST